jgi:putative FmdB family regulatory protein
MPIYEYRRPDGTTFELIQSFSEPALEKDPDTGVKVERVLHAPAVHFKGKGFYNTDYGTKKRQRETAAAGGEGSGGDGAGSANGASSEGKGSAGSSEGKSGESKSGGGESGGSESGGGGSEKGSGKDTSTAKPKVDSKPVAAAK